jgi:hypothetical protein
MFFEWNSIFIALAILAILLALKERFAPVGASTYMLSPSLFGGSWLSAMRNAWGFTPEPINQSTRFTRNQSYDIRGDPHLIPSPRSVGLFYNSPYADIAYAARSWRRPLNIG